MAIPIFVPDEYGPIGQASSSQNGNTHVNTNVNNHNRSFIHQLILELYSLYQNHNFQQTTTTFTQSEPPIPVHEDNDANNNNHGHPDFTQRRRRRHPAGGRQNLQNCHLISLTADTKTSEPQIRQSTENTETESTVFEFKLSICEISIGCQLRKIADLFQEDFEQNVTRLRQPGSKFKLTIVTSSWSALVLAGVFLSAGATAIVLKQRNSS